MPIKIKKISQFNELEIPASTDELAIVDKLTDETKKIKRDNLLDGVVRKLATKENIDFTVQAKTNFYTIPTGFKLVLIDLIIRTREKENPTENGTAHFQRVSDDYEFASFSSSELPPAVDSFQSANYREWLAIGLPLFPAGEALMVNIDPPDGGDAVSFDLDLIGYLIKE